LPRFDLAHSWLLELVELLAQEVGRGQAEVDHEDHQMEADHEEEERTLKRHHRSSLDHPLICPAVAKENWQVVEEAVLLLLLLLMVVLVALAVLVVLLLTSLLTWRVGEVEAEEHEVAEHQQDLVGDEEADYLLLQVAL